MTACSANLNNIILFFFSKIIYYNLYIDPYSVYQNELRSSDFSHGCYTNLFLVQTTFVFKSQSINITFLCCDRKILFSPVWFMKWPKYWSIIITSQLGRLLVEKIKSNLLSLIHLELENFSHALGRTKSFTFVFWRKNEAWFDSTNK